MLILWLKNNPVLFHPLSKESQWIKQQKLFPSHSICWGKMNRYILKGKKPIKAKYQIEVTFLMWLEQEFALFYLED